MMLMPLEMSAGISSLLSEGGLMVTSPVICKLFLERWITILHGYDGGERQTKFTFNSSRSLQVLLIGAELNRQQYHKCW